MGDVISLEAYRKRQAAKAAALLDLPKPKPAETGKSKRPGPGAKPVRSPIQPTEQDKDPPVD